MAQKPARDDTTRTLPQHARMTDARHWFVIVNPAAGRGQGARYWTRLSAALAAAKVPVGAREAVYVLEVLDAMAVSARENRVVTP